MTTRTLSYADSIREAHAQGGAESEWQSSINLKDGVRLAPARTLIEKQDHASLCLRKLDLPFAAVVDGMDGAAETAYQAWPSRLYLIGRDGKVAFNFFHKIEAALFIEMNDCFAVSS